MRAGFYRTKKNLSTSNNSRLELGASARHMQGLTLIELVITLTIFAILASIATPSIIGQLAAMEAKKVRHEITNTLKSAKAESLIRHQNVFVCLIDESHHCKKDGNHALLMFLDKNNDNKYSAGVDELLSESQLGLKYATVHLRAGNRDYTRFSADSGNPRGFMGHIKYCPKAAFDAHKYKVSFNMAGIIKFKPNHHHETDCPT